MLFEGVKPVQGSSPRREAVSFKPFLETPPAKFSRPSGGHCLDTHGFQGCRTSSGFASGNFRRVEGGSHCSLSLYSSKLPSVSMHIWQHIFAWCFSCRYLGQLCLQQLGLPVPKTPRLAIHATIYRRVVENSHFQTFYDFFVYFRGLFCGPREDPF